MSGECEGNCGKCMKDCGGFYWTIMSSDGQELDFCSLVCMDSWLHEVLT